MPGCLFRAVLSAPGKKGGMMELAGTLTGVYSPIVVVGAGVWTVAGTVVFLLAVVLLALLLAHLQVDRRTRALKEEFARRRQLEDQLSRSVQLKAGGVFHDFNNLFQAILGCGELAASEVPADSPAHEYLSQIISAAENARSLVKQLTSLGYRDVTNLSRVDLDEILATQVPLLRHVVGPSIEIEFVPASGAKSIYAAPEQIKQVLLDLIENARDAMPKGGRITIATRRVVLEEGERPSREHILLSVSDEGEGIAAEDLAHIFEPFFTKRKAEGGLGLGLATVNSIVEGHGGLIDCESEVGKSTTFSIYLPAPVETGHRPSSGTPAVLPQATGESETILVADDDDSVRTISARALEAAGYTVLVASDGKEAVEIIRGNADRIDMVILDVVMPALSGKAVYDAMRDIKPGLPALFSSGCSYEQLEEHYRIDIPSAAMIQKPYKSEELLHEVRRLLDSTAA